jgi:hypothetical protein
MEHPSDNYGLATGSHTPQHPENSSKVKMETVLVLGWNLALN